MSGDAILFDIDGTLVDSTYHHAMAWHRAFTRCGLTIPMWRIHRTIGMGGDKLVGQVAGDDMEAERGDEIRAAWQEEYAAMIPDVPALRGAEELVRSVVAKGYVVALASSGEREFSEAALRTLGFGELVHTMTSSADVDDSKPDPDILGVTLDRVSAERSVLVGDTPYDVDAAGRIGLACVCVLTGGFSRTELEEAGAAVVVENLTELVGLDWSEHLRRPSG